MTRAETAADMLGRMSRADAIARAENIAHMHRSHAACSTYWSGVAALLAVSDHVPDVGTLIAEEDVFSFSDEIKERMKAGLANPKPQS